MYTESFEPLCINVKLYFVVSFSSSPEQPTFCIFPFTLCQNAYNMFEFLTLNCNEMFGNFSESCKRKSRAIRWGSQGIFNI